MTQIIYPPLKSASVGLSEIDLKKENPELYERLKSYIEAEESVNAGRVSVQATSQWYRAGSGPQPKVGGTWVGGDILAPFSTPPAAGIVSDIDYDYTKIFGTWASQITVRLYITNSTVTQAWVADITADDEGNVDAVGANIPANCRITYQMKVGNITGGLYNPPSIGSCDVTTNYTY